jgi:DNA gyrase subunit B
MTSAYKADSIQVLEGLDAVRMRPGMYIGSTGPRGLHHLLWEIVDNAIDEVANGFGSHVHVIIHSDNSVSVEDDGRGMPVDLHPVLKKPAVEVIYTQLHAGGKFDNKNYSYSGGLHGVGASVVNALARWLEVEVRRDGRLYYQRFESRKDAKSGKILSGKPVTSLEDRGPTRKKGSLVSFLPDDRVFETIEMESETVANRLRELAYLNQGVRICFDDLRLPRGESRQVFHYQGGIADFAVYLNEGKNVLHDTVICLSGEKDGIQAEIAIQYTDGYSENLFSYVNNIPTGEGGTHETGFKTALTKVLNDFARRFGLLKEKDPNLAGEDVREGMTAVLVVKMRNIQFEGQTKTKLGNTEARSALEYITAEKLTYFIEKTNNDPVIRAILEKAIKASKVRNAARKARDIARKKNSLDGAPLVGKLASCTGRDTSLNELFIVEGDSAGGSAKQGRDRRFQAILPLRGKPLNAEKKRLDQVLANEEFRTIISALGTGIGNDFDIGSLRYERVIILSDADQDGAHIRAILLTFFYRYMKELIAEGHVYVGLSPLYKITKAGKVRYAYSDKEMQQIVKSVGSGYAIQRYKGLGEMNPEQLWETTMDPKNRMIIQVSIEDAAQAEKMITTLMGEKVESRRVYISRHADFNKADILQEMGV